MNTNTEDVQIGLYEKFRVERTDGRSAEGEKHHGCEYFVLDLNHDPFAHAAIVMYAQKCVKQFPELADDLMRKASGMVEWMTKKSFAEMSPAEREAWSTMVYTDPERR